MIRGHHALRGGASQELFGQRGVGGNDLVEMLEAVLMYATEIVLRHRMALLGGELVKFQRLHQVALNALAGFIKIREARLRHGVPRAGGALVLHGGICEISNSLKQQAAIVKIGGITGDRRGVVWIFRATKLLVPRVGRAKLDEMLI